MSESLRGVTFRLLPVTRTNGKKLEDLARACRWVWNYFIAKNRAERAFDRCFHDTYGIEPAPARNQLSFFAMGKEFTRLRNMPHLGWLRNHSFVVVRHTLKDQADAWRRHFNGAGKPRSHSVSEERDGFTIPGNVKIKDDQLYIPKVGWCKLRRKGGNPHADNAPKLVRVTKRRGKWFTMVTYEVEAAERVDDGSVIGVDMNAGQVATSENEIHRLDRMARLKARQKRCQRMIARRKKGSNRRQSAKRKLAKTTAKIANKRNRWHHETSKKISNQAHTVAVEDLKTKAMTASAKGTTSEPGSQVKQKAGLNSSILDTGWSQMRFMLAYKAGAIVAVNPACTSRKCHVCGHVDAKNRRTQAEFKCLSCRREFNADINAAINIKASATGASGRGRVGPSGHPMIRQLDTKANPAVGG